MMLNPSTPFNCTSQYVQNLIVLPSFLILLDLCILIPSLFVIVSLALHSTNRSSVTRRLVLNQSFADIFVGSFVLTPTIASTIHQHSSSEWSPPPFFCSIHMLFDGYCCAVSIYSTVLLGVDRYLAVCRALRYKRILSSKMVRILIGITWSVATLPVALMASSRIWVHETSMQTNTTTDESWLADRPVIWCTAVRRSYQTENTGIAIIGFFLTFVTPFCILTFCFAAVAKKVIRNARSMSAGVVKNDKNQKQHFLSPYFQRSSKRNGSVESSAGQEGRESSKEEVSKMRIHVGGNHAYHMTVDRRNLKQNHAKVFSHLPGTLKCGFLILSTSVPNGNDQKFKANASDSAAVSLMAKAETKNAQSCKVSANSLNAMNTAQRVDLTPGGTNTTPTLSTSLLKPPKWYASWNATRKSDSDFANIMAMRRCALMPMVDKKKASASSESLDLLDHNQWTVHGAQSPRTNNKFEPTYRSKQDDNSDNDEYNASVSSDVPIQSGRRSRGRPNPRQSNDPYHVRELKAVVLFLVSCGTFLLAWMPFNLLQIAHFRGTSLSIVHGQTIYNWAYFCRFIAIALNPYIYGLSGSDDLRKSFRWLIHCGKKKHEKKALQRLVLAGLSAARISYGRPIIPPVSRPSE